MGIVQIIDMDSLMIVMKQLEMFRNQKLEVIIFPTEEQERVSKKSSDIE